MQVRNHTKLKYKGVSQWPPGWGGSIGRGTQIPIGETGTLTQVEYCPAHGPLPAYVAIDIALNGRSFSGIMQFEDTDFAKRFVEFLSHQIGISITVISGMELDC